MRPTPPSRLPALVAAAVALVLLLPVSASGHAERDASFPDGNGRTPELLTSGPTLLVCKKESPQHFSTLPLGSRARNQRLYQRCMDDGFRHIQAAVDAAEQRNTRILVLPGVYREEPSRRAHERGCDALDGDSNGDEPGTPSLLSYKQQRKCPHVQNLIAIFGDGDGDRECDLPQCGLQIQGTGSKPDDVVIDGQFKTLNGIRADRLDGARFYNFTIQRFEFNALYILETDGFLIDRVVGRWNDEYAFLTFAVDHGRYYRCDGYGNGDSAVYPGSASDINTGKPHSEVKRYAVEIERCRSHHNAAGYSGTAGNSVHVFNSTFDRNSSGIVTDSVYPDHPGLPQDHAFFERNRIYSNNRNYVQYVQDGRCDRKFINRGYEHGIVCPVIPAPIGTGLLIAGGNYNKIEHNDIFDNWRVGTFQFHVPAAVRNEDDPAKQNDTSHNNRYRYNRLGYGTNNSLQPNGVDFWWDDQGEGNCWRGNIAKSGTVTENAQVTPTNIDGELPPCPEGSNWLPNYVKLGQIAPCGTYDRGDPDFRDPPGCDFFDKPPRPNNRGPARAEMTRTGGGTAVAAAAGVSRRAFPRGAGAVVLAPRSDEASALIAAPLAGEVDGPLLLTKRRRLNRTTADEVRRLDAQRAYIVGNTRRRVATMLRNAGVQQVVRINSGNRYANAARIARMMGSTEVYVTRGTGSRNDPSLTHAFSIAGLAAFQERPILLSRQSELPAATASALADVRPVNATLFGDRARLSRDVARAVDRRSVVVDRVGGHGRYRLSRAAANLALQGISNERKVWIASGTSGLDSLAAAAAVGQRDGVLLMVDRQSLSQSYYTRRWLSGHRLELENIVVVGGRKRLSATTADQIRTVTARQ